MVLYEWSTGNQPKFDYELLPKKKVLARIGYAKEKAIIYPLTGQIGTHKPGKKPTTAVQVNYQGDTFADDRFHLTCPRTILPKEAIEAVSGEAKKQDDSPSIVLFWIVRRACEKEETNLKLVYETFTAGLTQNGARPVTIEMPVLKNSKAIKKGDELVLYDADAKPTKKGIDIC